MLHNNRMDNAAACYSTEDQIQGNYRIPWKHTLQVHQSGYFVAN